MSYRTKILCLFVGLAAVTNGVLLTICYQQAERTLRQQIGTTALSIAATASAMIDIEAHQQLEERRDETTSTYQSLERILRKVRDANRRSDVRVQYLYTFIADPRAPGKYLFAVDSEEAGENKSHLGDPYNYKGRETVVTKMSEFQVQPEFVTDEWGTWLTVNAPIRNAAGQAIAAVGVDLDAADVVHQLRVLLFSGIAGLGASLLLALALALHISRRMSQPLAAMRDAVTAIGHGNLETQLDVKSRDEFGVVAAAINEMVAGLKQREIFKGTLVRYMSSQVAERVLSSGEMPQLRGDRRKITVLFADVRGFTALSESLSPEEVVTLLNDYFDKMIEAISQHHGMLNKFMGDGLMAVFGALEDDPFQEEHAIEAALEMRCAIGLFRERILKERQIELHIGIGINTGLAIVGNIGSEQRMEFTAIGDTVNLASRLESTTKEFSHDIIVSDYTQVAVRNKFQFKPLGSVQVKGRTDAVSIHAVLSANGVRAGAE